MKIGMISDLHVDVNAGSEERGIEELLLERAAGSGLEALIIAGDISNDVNLSLKVLRNLRSTLDIPVLFVPGNHDYWSKNNGVTDTWSIYEQYRTFEGCLSEKPYELNEEWTVVGSSGWYDYSMGEPKYTFEDYERMEAMGRTWQDSLYVQWGRGNREMHRYFYESLERDLEASRGKKIVMVTHMLSHPHFKVPLPNERWEYFNAFLGSLEYGELIRKYDVSHAVMGHVHYRKRLTVETDHGQAELICACLGNRPEWKLDSLEAEIDQALQIIELGE